MMHVLLTRPLVVLLLTTDWAGSVRRIAVAALRIRAAAWSRPLV
jgi:hypothetical protein